MKKRIKSLVYDTSTAKEIVTYTDFPVSSNEHVEETLYRKRTGEFFLYGKGNANSGYATYNNMAGGYEPGQRIIPLTFDEAKEWYERNLNNEEYDFTEEQYKELFVVERKDDEAKRTFTLNLSVRAKKELEKMATIQGKSQSEIVENLILSEAEN